MAGTCIQHPASSSKGLALSTARARIATGCSRLSSIIRGTTHDLGSLILSLLWGTSTGRLGTTGVTLSYLLSIDFELPEAPCAGNCSQLAHQKPKNTGGQIPPDPYKGAKEKQVLPVRSAWSLKISTQFHRKRCRKRFPSPRPLGMSSPPTSLHTNLERPQPELHNEAVC